ncbi:MAG: hypothetical protein WAV73_01065 [Candidatus Moraniibacteriota bacterium]
MNNEKIIILSITTFLFVSFLFLGYEEQRQIDPTGKNSWWTVYFENPQTQNLTFTIKNTGKAKKFHWKESTKDNALPLREADVFVPAGQKITIPLMNDDLRGGERIILEISDESNNKKEIYKSIE